MLIRCDRCGASVDDRGAAVAACGRCHASLRVDAMAALAPRPVRPPSAPWVVPPTGAELGEDARRATARAGRGTGTFVACAVILAGWSLAAAAAAWDPFGWRLHPTDEATLARVALPPGAAWSQTFRGTTEGDHGARALGGACRGYVPSAPHASLALAEARSLALHAAGREDVVLVVRGPDGVFACDDDSGGGTNARVARAFGPGVVRVWVGTLHEDRASGFELRVESESLGNVRLDATGLAPDAPPTDAVVDLDRAPAGETPPAPVRGGASATAVGAQCRGMVAIPPSHVLATSHPVRVVVESVSREDLVLVARPGGAWRCDDDSGDGANARLVLDLAPGRTPVWVGEYRTDATPRTGALRWRVEPAGGAR